jgi:hypothetical protein
MKSTTQYRHLARDSRELAQQTSYLPHREHLLRLAAEWDSLANDVEAKYERDDLSMISTSVPGKASLRPKW